MVEINVSIPSDRGICSYPSCPTGKFGFEK